MSLFNPRWRWPVASLFVLMSVAIPAAYTAPNGQEPAAPETAPQDRPDVTPAPAAPPVAAPDPGAPPAETAVTAAQAGRPAPREQARERAFETTQDLLMPLSPAQLDTLIRSLNTSERLSSTHTPPEALMGTEALDLAASRPPVVRVAQGYGTSLVFTDRTGRGWPLTAYQGFNEGLFSVSASTTTGNKDDLPSVLVVQPTAAHGTGNLVVTLKGLETPIVLTLALGQKAVDVRKEFRLALAGPNAAPEYHPSMPAGVETALINVLNGLPPTPSAKPVEVSGVEATARAWREGDVLYLRTVASLYSPEYSEHASNRSGLHAYKLPAMPVLLASYHGAMVEILTED